jgi:hypothetical protein
MSRAVLKPYRVGSIRLLDCRVRVFFAVVPRKRELVPRNKVRSNLPITVVVKPESLVYSPELLARSFAI